MDSIPNCVRFEDRNTINFSRIFDVSIERAWQAISEKEYLDQWFMTTEIELEVGGRYTFFGGWSGWVGE